MYVFAAYRFVVHLHGRSSDELQNNNKRLLFACCASLLLLLRMLLPPHGYAGSERLAGQVYRAFNNLQGDNESVSSVSTDGGFDLLSSQQHQQQQHPASDHPAAAASNPAQSTTGAAQTSANERPSNTASRRDDDGNVEFDFD